MFLATTGGDVQYARMATTEAVNAYSGRAQIDLFYIAQIIAFGLAILDSLSRSMAATLPVTLVLRLRGNALSLGRAAERCRRELRDPPSNDAATDHPAPEVDAEVERQGEEAVIADITRAEQRLAEVTASARPARQPAAATPMPHPSVRIENPRQEMLQAARIAQRRAAQPSPPSPAAGTGR